jgi:hypothetical protein
MALASSGQISMSQINTELGRSSSSQISLDSAENGSYATINSNSSSKPSSSNPASMSEWYSYNHSAGGIVTDNLVFHMDAGNTSSLSSYSNGASINNVTWSDLQNSYNATIKGSTYTTTYGGGINFGTTGNTSNYILFDHTAISTGGVGSPPWSVEIWSIADANNGSLSTLWGAGGASNKMLMYFAEGEGRWHYNDVGDTRLSHSSVSGNSSYKGTGSVTQWVMVAPSSTSTQSVLLYKNGASESHTAQHSRNTNITGVSSGMLMIGQEQDSNGGGFASNQCWLGRIYIVRVYGDALSTTEIASNWNTNKSRFGH